jgi:GTP-binding protein
MDRSIVVSLIGRPNVGKSSIFNRLVSNRFDRAIVHDKPGVTRDRHYAITTLDEIQNEESKEIIVVDTGGFYPETKDSSVENRNAFFDLMVEHAETAISESDLVLMVVDIKEGLSPFDKIVARRIRAKNNPLWLLINKYDSDAQMGEEADFYTLGMEYEDMFKISAVHNIGVEDLKRRVQEFAISSSKLELPSLQRGVTPRESVVAKVAIVGAPNAGKSTLLNKLIGSNRALVSDIAGTTVDQVDGYFDLYFGKAVASINPKSQKSELGDFEKDYELYRQNNPAVYSAMIKSYIKEDGDEVNEDFLNEGAFEDENQKVEDNKIFEGNRDDTSLWRAVHVVDTAGIRKKKNVEESVESMAVYSALRAITDASIVLFVINAEKGISHQDRRLIDISIEKGKSVIICLNKYDLVSDELKDHREKKEWLQDMKDAVPWLDYCELIPISAKFGKRLKGLKQAIARTVLVRRKNIRSGELNKAVYKLVERHTVMPTRSRGVHLKVRYATMIKSAPPTFLLFSNRSQGIPANYRRYLAKGLRSEFNLINTPVHLIFRSGQDLEKRLTKVK